MLLETFTKNVGLLKTKANRQSVIGTVIGVLTVLVATALSAYVTYGALSPSGMLKIQRANSVLWVLDAMPFVFAFWGQYVGSIIAFEAGAMVMDQTQELRTQTAALEIKAQHEMTHDSLTGLPNRILFQDRLEQAIGNARREGRRIGLIMLDLDRFKEINESLGHYNGDRVLKQIAVRLQGSMRESDALGRVGGDEFGVLLANFSAEADLVAVAKTIRKTLETPFALEGLTLAIQASIGAAVFPEHGSDVDTLLQRADVAMYAAKQDNKGFAIYSPKLDTMSPHRLTLMGELRQAMERDELVLYYQPKIDSARKCVIGVEALVRWRHPKHNLLMPQEFIPLAERTGLIKQLSLWVLKKGLQQSAEWRARGLNIDLAVNLSAQDVQDPELPDAITGMLAQYDVDAKRLVLEITETSIMADPDRALEILNRLSAMGVRISIDDFGTGYSSLAYLKKMPVSEIKIDRSFVRDMLQSPNDQVIVQATIGLGQNLGLNVVAEGMETSATMTRLRELGCTQMQGYYISRPLPAAEFSRWLMKITSLTPEELGKGLG
ncbi:MAG: GGDEF-domain containing protein [Desulfobulbaceae bacterium A2]|nr:MAG: GGDEF-domain containing protein [Desulfobulbaceae bacterium A2]